MKKEEFVLTKKCRHVAFIMDGNGRWAKKRGLPRHLGHKEGCQRIVEIARACQDFGIEVMTLYAFSTENWNRPQDEIDNLFNYLDEFFNRYLDEFMEKGVRVSHMGDIARLPEHSQKTLKDAIEKTKDNKNFVFNICLNYGSRQEILKAVKEIAQEAKDGNIEIDAINEETIANHLYSKGLPEVDLMIRTSGEQRLSNFVLYQVAYAEFVFTPVHWPDFKKPQFIECLKEFCNRNRRFGSLKNQ